MTSLSSEQPPKRHRTPLSVAKPAMKNQKKREEKKKEEVVFSFFSIFFLFDLMGFWFISDIFRSWFLADLRWRVTVKPGSQNQRAGGWKQPRDISGKAFWMSSIFWLPPHPKVGILLTTRRERRKLRVRRVKERDIDWMCSKILLCQWCLARKFFFFICQGLQEAVHHLKLYVRCFN